MSSGYLIYVTISTKSALYAGFNSIFCFWNTHHSGMLHNIDFKVAQGTSSVLWLNFIWISVVLYSLSDLKYWKFSQLGTNGGSKSDVNFSSDKDAGFHFLVVFN